MTKDYPDWHMPLLWAGQYDAVHPTPIWAALQGQSKSYFYVSGTIIDGAQACADTYVVPEGRVLYVYGFGASMIFGGQGCAILRKNGTAIAEVCGYGTVVTPGVPWVYRAGDELQACAVNRSGQDNQAAIYWWGWEA